MNGTSGFQEVRSSASRRSIDRLLHEQRHLFGPGSWHLLRTRAFVAHTKGAQGTGSAVCGGPCPAPNQTQEKK
jgi:hypothetical protein